MHQFLLWEALIKIFREYYKGPKSDHFDGCKFFNPWNPQKHSFWDIIRWKLFSKSEDWQLMEEVADTDLPPDRVEGDDLRICFVGHSTFLIQTQGINILTDPIWSDRASPFKHLGPKRHAAPGVHFKDLPRIDLILISHCHYDHMDIQTINKLYARDKSLIITPLGNDAIIHSYNDLEVQTLDWYQSIHFKHLEIHLMPSQHWSARSLFDRNQALWGAFIMTSPSGNILFMGDTGYDDQIFKKIKEKFGDLRLALLPIGAYKPNWFMRYSHMNPEEAIEAYKDLGRPFTIAMHFKTFKLSDEGIDEPCKTLEKKLKEEGIDPDQFRTLKFGETWFSPNEE